jgi:hypothetical protein
MRTISAGGLAKLAQKKGTEPILILEVDWGVGAPVSYADRDIDTSVKGRIVQVGELDNVVDILNSNSSQELSVVLDDTDGTIKAIMDAHDIHQRDVRVYQWLQGLDLSDKFLLFAGKISSPVSWSEAARTVEFSIISQLEDKEFGFSAEEGQFPYLPKDLVGRPWPVIFGKVLDCPALQINKAVSGSTLCGVGILSGDQLHEDVPLGGTNCGLGMSLAMMSENISHLSACFAAWSGIDDVKAGEILDQINSLQAQLSLAANTQNNQRLCALEKRVGKLEDARENSLGCNPVRILGGEDFPQNNTITLNINGGLFTGRMNDDEFTISKREHPENDEKAEDLAAGVEDELCSQPTPPQFFDWSMAVPPGRGDLFGSTIRRHGFIICNEEYSARPSAAQVAQHFWADSGSRVVIASDEPITYIVSITPGTVLAVKAFKTLNGVRKLVNVPNNLWEAETQNYGTITAVQVVTSRPLSSIEDQGWDDDLYVTFESTIGPHTTDILEYIIENWTDLTHDATSFDYVKTKLTNFPSNFPVLERKNTLELIREIAFQARCAVWLSNGVFYLKYLPEEPASDQSITVSDIASGTIEVGLTPTEDIITKMVVTWHLSYAEEEPNKFILRHNVNKYGTKEEEFDWYIYNQPDIILKCATFWLIRKCFTWKKIKFQGFLNLLRLETFDTVNLELPGYVASGDVKAIVENASYDSESNLLSFECLVPVTAGTMTIEEFFWPSALPVTTTWPTVQAINNGNAGGNGIGAGATGLLPVGSTSTITDGSTVFVGGPNVVFRPNSDYGDRTPSDTDFTPQTIIPPSVFANVESSPNPNPDLRLNYIDPLPAMALPPNPATATIIDIRRTKIIDSDNPGAEAILASVIRSILDGSLVIDTTAKFGDGTNSVQFDFQFDDDGGKFGAGTAFLQD